MCVRTTSGNNTVFSGIFAVKSSLSLFPFGYGNKTVEINGLTESFDLLSIGRMLHSELGKRVLFIFRRAGLLGVFIKIYDAFCGVSYGDFTLPVIYLLTLFP